MLIFNYTSPKMIVAEKGKKIREKSDIYIPESINENGEKIEEHKPFYSSTIFLADNIKDDEIENLYVEEDIE